MCSRFLDLEKLAVAVELTLDEFFVERVTGFGLLQILDHHRVLLIRLRGSSHALRGGGPGRLEHRAQHLSQPLLFIRLEFRELLHLLVLGLLQCDLARLESDATNHHGLLQPSLLGLTESLSTASRSHCGRAAGLGR